jgi:putative ABC transport system permease protein
MDDLKVSLRQLLKTPGFTLAAIGVLAVGIGLNAAMFSVVHAMAFAARPFAASDRLVQIYSRDERTTDDYRAFSHHVYQEVAARQDLFAGVLAHNLTVVGVGEEKESRRTFSAIVSASYFDVLGVPPIRGRGFTVDETRPGQDVPVVVASYAYWKRRGFDPGLVGSTIRINERLFTVVGITPPGFTGTMSVFGPELFFPLGVFNTLSNDFQSDTQRTLERPDAFNLFLVARLKDGLSIAAASEAVALFGRSLARTFPAEYDHYALSVAELPKFGTSTSPSNEAAVTTLGVVLLGMTGAVLLTVCLNLASMLLARGRARRKEFAVRLALGGSRARIVRQLLIEGLLLSLVGGALGVALGNAAIDAVLSTLATMLPVTVVLEGTTSFALIAATITFCLLATLAFALGPALKHSRADIVSDLKAQSGDDPGPRTWRFVPRNPLVAAQVALSLSLLIAAGLFLRMALGAALVDLGFGADDTVLAEVDGRLGGLDDVRSLDVYAHIEARLAALPGVQAVSVGALVPLGTVSMSKPVQRAGVRPAPGAEPTTPDAGRAFYAPWNAIGAAYFETMGIQLQQGRPFTTAETYGTGAPRAAIIDESLARKLWPDGGALGQRIQWAGTDSNAASQPMEIVGIVSRTQRELFEDVPRGAVYVPLGQEFTSNVYFHVRPVGPSTTLVEGVRREIRAAAPGLPLFGVKTFASHVSSSLEYWGLTLSASMFALFGGLAMLVAIVGIYGVTAYAVARRTREIGVRMAVGAGPGMVLRLILGESLRTTLGGVATGWLLGLGVGQIMASMFVDLSAFDPWTFAIVPAGFILTALAATWVPAHRATVVNPVTALRSE